MEYDLVIKNAQCMLAVSEGNVSKSKLEKTEIGIKDGRIETIGSRLSGKAAEVIDAKNLTVLPGVIDSQVHFREPGLTHKEDLNTGTRAAILGGVTSVFEMPNTKPPTADAAALEEKLKCADGRAWCDYAFFAGATADNIENLGELERHPGCCGVKLFMGSSTGDLLVESDEKIKRILQNGKRRMAVHAEDEYRLRERRKLLEQIPTVLMHPLWRDDVTALLATQRVVRMAEQVGRPVHVLHVSTAQEIDFLQNHKQLITVEVTPQHLTLHSPDCYETLGTLAQMNPPIRDQVHQDKLWEGIRSGVVDVIGSDHAPHTLEEKKEPYPKSPSGMPGVQTLLPIMLNHVNEERLSLSRLVDLVCINPARIYNLKDQGAIRQGFKANLTLVDLKRKQTIDNQWIASKCGWTPFHGFKVTGWPVSTIIRGNVVMREAEVLGNPVGRPCEFIL